MVIYCLPEQLFELIEINSVQRYGDQGRQALYSAGKKFGYIFSSLSNFTTINNTSPKEISDFAYLLVRYIEGTYAQQAEHEADVEHKRFNISFDNFIICRHNGLGHVMTEGGIAGIWSYGMQDKSIESVQLECQGRGNQRCYVICAPDNEIQEKTERYFCEKNLKELKADSTYKTLNEIRQASYATNSLKDLLDAGFFTFKRGILSYKNNRFFHCDTHLLYLLDEEIAKLPDGDQVIFDACFEYGKNLREAYGKTDYQKFIPDFFSALGFGDILIIDSDKLRIVFIYYPWTVFSKHSNYIILRGIMSGFVSSALDKNIQFNSVNVNIDKYLTVTISE